MHTHETHWDPKTLKVALNTTLDACFVPDGIQGGLRLDNSHVVAIDGFIGEPERLELLECLSEPGEGFRGRGRAKYSLNLIR